MVELDQETEHCSVLNSSYLSCLPNDFWEMQSAYSSLWPSVSFILGDLAATPGRIKTGTVREEAEGAF